MVLRESKGIYSKVASCENLVSNAKSTPQHRQNAISGPEDKQKLSPSSGDFTRPR